jgi:hypothetical protein
MKDKEPWRSAKNKMGKKCRREKDHHVSLSRFDLHPWKPQVSRSKQKCGLPDGLFSPCINHPGANPTTFEFTATTPESW